MIDLVRGIAPRYLWGAVGLLAAGLLVTALASLYVKADVEAAAQRELDFAANEIRLNIADRLDASAQILRSGAAFLDASETVSRKDWRAFTERLQVEQQLPGIQGVGFALSIPRERLAEHVRAIRREGFSDYQVTPAGERETYSSIIYLEPFSGRNLRAFGYDMFSEPVRRAAMERARDENAAALSGKVVLVQETGQDVQAGALMYVPVYRHGLPTDTVEQRRAALQGWVYSPYRMTDLMRGTLSGWDAAQKGKQLDLQVYDGDVVSADALLYDSRSAAGKAPASSAAQVTRLIPVDYAGHGWTLRITQVGGLAASADYGSVWLVLIGGTIISLLLFGLVLSLLSTRAKAQRMAERLTGELRESDERHRTILRTAMDGFWLTDAEGRLMDVNEAYSRMSGYSVPELLGMRVSDLEVGEAGGDIAARIRKIVAQGEDRFESRHRRKDGSLFDVEISVRRQAIEGGWLAGFLRDITARKRAEQELLESLAEQAAVTEGVIAALARTVEVRDPYTAGHQRRVGELAAAMALRMRLGEERAEGLRVAGMLHDVGKINIPAEILSKPGLLTTIELELIKGHAQAGYEILAAIHFPWPVAEMARQHHERQDGSGYPRGLTGEDILPEARILAVADVVEAMASHRPYRPALGLEAALAEVRAGAGTRYDAAAVAACEGVFAEGFAFSEA